MPTLRESLEQMRREMGDEAMILSSKQIVDDDGDVMHEVIAGISPDELENYRNSQRKPPVEITQAAGGKLAQRNNQENKIQEDRIVSTPIRNQQTVNSEERNTPLPHRTVRSNVTSPSEAQPIMTRWSPPGIDSTYSDNSNSHLLQTPQPKQNRANTLVESTSLLDSERYNKDELLPLEGQTKQYRNPSVAMENSKMEALYKQMELQGQLMNAMIQELNELRTLTTTIVESSQYKYSASLPIHCRKLYQSLRDSGFGEEQSMWYLSRLISKGFGNNEVELRTELATIIAKSIVFAPTLKKAKDKGTYLITGQQGVGKTSTALKLAITLKLAWQTDVAVVSYSDSQPISEYSKELSRVYGFKLLTAQSLEELTSLCNSKIYDVLIVDDNSIKYNTPTTQKDVKELIEATSAIKSYVVLPATMNGRTIDNILGTLIAVDSKKKIQSVIATKLDESDSSDELLTQLKKHQLPISFFSAGSAIPDNLEIAIEENFLPIALPKLFGNQTQHQLRNQHHVQSLESVRA
jgi:flagellar biosynthesis GTPase FlhF